jgi:hypothetical protein
MSGIEMLNLMFISTAISVIVGIAGAFTEKSKKRNAIGWLIFCAVFLFPILIIIGLIQMEKN